MKDIMKDRLGVDDLSAAMGIAGMALALVGSIADLNWLLWAGLAVVLVALARAFSKNLTARKQENDRYLELIAKIPGIGKKSSAHSSSSSSSFARQARTAKTMWRDRKVKAFLKCPNCGQQLAVPRGKGRLIVTCPKCQARMETHT